MIAVGAHLLGQVDPLTVRMATGLGGGVGRTRQELCGALSGGVLLIGALHGRSQPRENVDRCMQIVARCREAFAEAFGATRCQDLRDLGFGSEAKPCALLVERAAQLLLGILAAEGQRREG